MVHLPQVYAAQAEMANLQPEIDRIKEEYKDNQDLVSLFLVRPVSLRLVSCESEVQVRDAGPVDSTVNPTMRAIVGNWWIIPRMSACITHVRTERNGAHFKGPLLVIDPLCHQHDASTADQHAYIAALPKR
jgi:hypothetical protein